MNSRTRQWLVSYITVSPRTGRVEESIPSIVRTHLHFFPSDLTEALSDYARNPLYSSDSHSALASALRRYDTLDLRPTVQELANGQMFSLDGKLVMVKKHLLRKRFQCVSIDGRTFYVSPTARVHTLYHPQGDGD